MAIVNKFILQGESKQLLDELKKAENAYNDNLLAIEKISIKINENKKEQIEANKKAIESKKKLEAHLAKEIELRRKLKTLDKGTEAHSIVSTRLSDFKDAKQPLIDEYKSNKNRVSELKELNKELSVEKDRITLLNKEVKREADTAKKAYQAKTKELKEWNNATKKAFAEFKKNTIAKNKAREEELAKLKKLKDAEFDAKLKESFPSKQKELDELIKYEQALENASKNRAKRSLIGQKIEAREQAQEIEHIRRKERKLELIKKEIEKSNKNKGAIQKETHALKLKNDALKEEKRQRDLASKKAQKELKQRLDNRRAILREQEALKNSILVYSKAEQVEKKYDALRKEANKAYNDGIITKEQLQYATKNLAKAQKIETQSVNDGTNALVRHIRQMESLVVGFYALKKAYDTTLGRGHEFNKLIETETVGLKLLIAQNLRNVDVHGNTVTALQKFEYAQTKANEAIKIAREINVQTPHTLGETLQIYKLLVPQVLKLGGSLEDVGKITKNVSVVGASMGIEFQQLLKTVDSLMSGEMQESGLKRAMEQFGITQKEVNKTIRDGGNVVELFIEKLKQVDPATIAISKTWQGATAQFINQWDELWAEVNKPIFDAFKSSLVSSAEALKNNKEEIKTTIEWVREGIGVVTTFGMAWATYTGYVWLADKATKTMGNTALTTRQKVTNLSKSLWAIGKANAPLMLVVGAFELMHLWTRKEERALENLNKIAKLTTDSLLKMTRARFADSTVKLKKGLQDSTNKLNELRTAMAKLNKGEKLEVFSTSSFGITGGLDIIDRATMSLEEQKDVIADMIEKEEQKKELYTEQLLVMSKISKATQKEAEHKRELTEELQRQKQILANLNFKAMEYDKTPADLKDKIAKATTKIKELNIELGKVSKKIKDEVDSDKILYKASPISDTQIQALKQENEQLDKIKTLKAEINKLDKQRIRIEEYLSDKKGKISKDDRIKYEKALNLVLENQRLKKKELLKQNETRTKAEVANAKKAYKTVKDEFKIKSQLLELEVLQAKLSGKYNKLEVLQKELKLLKEQSTNGLKDFDLNKHKIDILNKQLEIQKEQKRLKEEQHNIELSIIQENSKKQLETDTKRAEAERLYQELLGNNAYAENIKYWELKNKLQEGGINLSIEQIKMLEKQREAQEALTNATRRWVDALVGGVLAGKDLGDVFHSAMDGFNKSITDSFSKSITGSIMESIKKGSIVDFGIFDDSGNLTSVGKNGAIALGNLFVKTAFGDNKNAQRGAEFGQAVGFALGGVTGAIGGQIGGAILGSMMGGKVSYYTRVNEDGTVEAHKRKSGGLFHSSSDKILESETRQLQTAFDQTVKTYENLLEDLFKINDKIEVIAGKYNTGDLLNKIIPQDVIDSWTGADITQSELDHLKALSDTYADIKHHYTSADFIYDEADVERAKQALDNYVKELGVTVNEINVLFTTQTDVALTDLQQEARNKSNEIRKAWEAYAELKDKSFNEVFIESLQQLQQTSINVFETLYRDDKVKVLEERAKRYKKAFEDVHETIYGTLYAGKSDRRPYTPINKVPNQVTLENYDIMRERAIGKGATPEQVEAWNRLGQILIEDAKNADELKNAIEAKKKAEEEFKKSIAVSVRSFEDWVGTFNKSDLDKALYNRTRAEEDYKKALEAVGLQSATAKDILELLNNANKDNLEDYQHLAEAYRENQEAQLAYNNALADSKNGVDTVIKSTKDLKALIDSFNDIKVNWKDYNATLGMDDLEKVNYQIQQTSHNLGLVGVTFENFGSLLNGIKSDVEAGKINDDELKNWSELNGLLQQQHDIQLQNADERIKQLEEEREEILKNRDAIRSSMESIINAQISSIKADISNRTSSISSLQNSMSSYRPTQTVYSHDIYSAIGDWSYDKNKEIENSIKTWHDQQIKALEDADKKAREQWEARKKRLQDEENLRVKNENARIDSLNEQIRLNNQLADTINSMKDSVTKTFNDLYGNTQTLEASLYDALNSGEYSDVSSLFSSYTQEIQDSNLTDTEAYIKIAYANRDIQNVVAPEKKDELPHIEAKTIEIADYTSTLTEDSKKINEATVTMYEALIKQNKENLPNLQDEVKKIFEQNKKYFDKDSDFYKFLERGATELTYTEKMEEQKKLWEDYQKEAREFNNKKLGTLEKIDLSFNKYASSNLARVNNNTNDIKKLEAKLDKLYREQQEANKINKALLEEQRTANKLAKQTADNTKEKIIAGGVL